MSGVLPASGWLLFSLLSALAVARAAMAYARRHGMLDQPGQRRSHHIPTPRGGGVGIVVAALVFVPGLLWAANAGITLALLMALVLVAAAGWWDDHRSLPALPRLLVQVLAVLWFAGALAVAGVGGWWLPVLLVAGVWSINLHNFMDGIDGLLAQQGVFVGAGLALLAYLGGTASLALACGCLAAACLGFWWLNRSPARIFMGDVGSGSVGLLIFAFTALLWQADAYLVWPALLLSSAFAVDASLTLLSRMLQGRRWYAPHREHLYQWLVRRGHSHRAVCGMYMAWNLGVAAPLAWLAWGHLPQAWLVTMTTYVVAAALWLLLKRRCLRRDLPRRRRVVA